MCSLHAGLTEPQASAHRGLCQPAVVVEEGRQVGWVAGVRKLLQAADLLRRLQRPPPVQIRALAKEGHTWNAW